MIFIINNIGISMYLPEKFKTFSLDSYLSVKFTDPEIGFSGLTGFLLGIWNNTGVTLTTPQFHSFNDFMYECFIKSIMLKVNLIAYIQNSGPIHNHWVGFDVLVYNDNYCNIWLSCLLKMLSNKYFRFILWGLILFLMQYMRSNFLLDFILKFVSDLISILTKILYAIFAQIFLGNASTLVGRSSISGLSNKNIHALVFGLGSITYLILGYYFDFVKHRVVQKKNLYFNNKYITHIIIGLLYGLNIFIGVFSTTSFWYLTNNKGKWPIYILTTSFSGIFAWLWRFLGSIAQTSHILRSFTELLAFTCIAWSTFFSWELWTAYVTYPNLLGSILGGIFHLLFSILAIINEMNSTPNCVAYGIFYVLNFTGVAISTNSLYLLMTTNYNSYLTSLLLTIGGFIFTVFLHPDVYRHMSVNERNFWLSVFLYAMSYFTLFFSFVTSTSLLYATMLNAML